MGSIVSIYSNPKKWRIVSLDLHVEKRYGGEKLYKVLYGKWDDELSGEQDMSIYMRKSILDKVISGEYIVHPDSSFKRKLILIDKQTGKVVPRVVEDNDIVY